MNTQRQCIISQQNSFQYPTTQIMYEGGVKNAVTLLLTAKCLNLTAMNVLMTEATHSPFSFGLRLLKQKLSRRRFNTNAMFGVNMNGIAAYQVDSRLLLQEYGLFYNILGHML